MYSNLLQKMSKITNKRKNKIKEKEKNNPTIYINKLNAYLKELEDKIMAMKKGYIETLVEKHFEIDKDKKKEIILKANIPKKRNEVKRKFIEFMRYIKDKLEPQNQKYYYLLILKILNKYKNINKEEINQTMKLLKKKAIDGKISKDKKDKEKDNKYDDINLINQQNTKKGRIFKFFSLIIPFAYLFNYAYANFKA